MDDLAFGPRGPHTGVVPNKPGTDRRQAVGRRVIGFLVRISLWLFVSWFLIVSWGALPHFSEGFDQGLRYYGGEASQTLREFSRSGGRLYEGLRTRVQSQNFMNEIGAERRIKKYWNLEA